MSDHCRVAVVIHPIKRRAERAVEVIREQVAALGWPAPRVLTTTVAEPGGPQAAAALREGAERVVVGGGDGTVREVARELAGTGVGLGIVPLGTGNLFAHNLGLGGRRLDRVVATALTGETTASDAGWATFAGERHLFLVLAGMGHDAATARETRDWLKHHAGWLAYAESGLRHAVRRPIPMTVSLDDAPPHAVEAWSVLAGNCGRVRGGIVVFPGARLDDGRLDVMEVTVRHPWQWLPIAVKGLTGLRRDVPALHYATARRLTIASATPLTVQLDGDTFTGVSELCLETAPGALAVAVPH